MSLTAIKTIGLWLGFDHPEPFRREGAGRLVFYLVKYLIKNYPITCEIWSYECNKKEIHVLFKDLLENAMYSSRIKLITEETFYGKRRPRWEVFREGMNLAGRILFSGSHANWKRPYQHYYRHYGTSFCGWPKVLAMNHNRDNGLKLLPTDLSFLLVLIISGFIARGIRRMILKSTILVRQNIFRDPLAILANRYSQANCMVIPIVSLASGLNVRLPTMIIFLDMVNLEFYDYFIAIDANLKQWIEEGKKCAEDYARQNVYFCGISNYVIERHLLKYIPDVREENTGHIYLAAMVPDSISERVLSRDAIRKKYHIEGQYIFYPTQVRPYKNIITLLKALQILRLQNTFIYLVLTAQHGFQYDPNAGEYADKHGLGDQIIFCKSIPELDLYSLYAHADVVTVTSLFEGGFPLQALEALVMDAPLILSRIPVTLERLTYEGLAPETCGLRLYSPEDENELAGEIKMVLQDRGESIRRQTKAKRKLLSYTWDDVSRKYYECLSMVVERFNHLSDV